MITLKDYQDWCNDNKNRLWMPKLTRFQRNYGIIFWFFVFLSTFGLLTTYFSIFKNENNSNILFAILFGGIIIIYYFLDRFFNVLNVREEIACRLYKIANLLRLSPSEGSDIINELLSIKKLSSDILRQKPELFKEQYRLQNDFYDNLEKIPDHIYYFHLSKKNEGDILDFTKQLETLSHYIYRDHDKMSFILKDFLKSYSNSADVESNSWPRLIEKHFNIFIKSNVVRFLFLSSVAIFIGYILHVELLIEKKYILLAVTPFIVLFLKKYFP